jgi:sulfur-oxidizing protein SoxZ
MSTDAMRIRPRLTGDKTSVSVLVSHEMESGQRRAADGKLVPAWFIQTIKAEYAGKPVFSAQWGPAVSKNPFAQFAFKGGKVGEKVKITWIDNKGETRTDEAAIA